MSDEQHDEGESVEGTFFPSSITVNHVLPTPPVANDSEKDVMLRLNIITCLHNVGYDKYEEQAVRSLHDAHPDYFKSDF